MLKSVRLSVSEADGARAASLRRRPRGLALLGSGDWPVRTPIASTAGWIWLRIWSEIGAEPALAAAASWPSALMM